MQRAPNNAPVHPRKQLKALCRSLIEGINRNDHNSLILLAENNYSKYNHIIEFMNTKRRFITVNADVAAMIAAEGGHTPEGNTDAENQVRVAV